MNFNYTLLLILSILLLIQCYLKIKINLVTAILLGVLLIINELYRKKESFQNCDDPSRCHQEINMNNSLFNSQMLDSSTTDVPISDGLLCKLDKNLKKYQRQKDKITQQNTIVNMIKKNIISSDNETDSLIKNNDLSIFNPISEYSSNTPCPNTCHLISQENECKSELEYPINTNIKNICESITDDTICNDNCHCKYDNTDSKCKYNKLACTWLTSTTNSEPDVCRKRCEKYNKKNECNLASGNSITDKQAQYCQWDTIGNLTHIGTCIPKCNNYKFSDICLSDDKCEVDTANAKCRNKCHTILSQDICNNNSHCNYVNSQCQNKIVESTSPQTLPVNITSQATFSGNQDLSNTALGASPSLMY